MILILKLNKYNRIANSVRYHNLDSLSTIEKSIFLDPMDEFKIIDTIPVSLITQFQVGRTIPILANNFDSIFNEIRDNFLKKLPVFKLQEYSKVQKQSINHFKAILNDYFEGKELEIQAKELLLSAAATCAGYPKNYTSNEGTVFDYVSLPHLEKYKKITRGDISNSKHSAEEMFLHSILSLHTKVISKVELGPITIIRSDYNLIDRIICKGITLLKYMFEENSYIDNLINDGKFTELSVVLHLLKGKIYLQNILFKNSAPEILSDNNHIVTYTSKITKENKTLVELWLDMIILNRLISGAITEHTTKARS